MLQLQIGFPAGRYCAARMGDLAQPEWPPHPARVYSALVAAAYAGGRQPLEPERRVLEALEQAGPPMLAFPEADTTAGAISYVPANDEGTWLKKSHGPLFPYRQPRYFPAAYLLGEPEIVLAWSLDLNTDELELLDQLAARMTHLGTSHSLVTARFSYSDSSVADFYAPSPYGHFALKVPLPGRLKELDELHEMRGGIVRRPLPLCEEIVTYGHIAAKPVQPHASAYEWLVFRLKGAVWGANTAHILGKSLRKCIMSRLDAQAPAAVHGHDQDQLHVAWIPLPFVGHPHADGRILGIGIALPITLTGQERTDTFFALNDLLTCWTLPGGQKAELEPAIEGPDTLRTLRRQTWADISTCWSTVTPVMLDRPPKHFESSRVTQALVQSLVNAGFPPPVSVMLSQTSDFEGGPAVREIPIKLPRTHARVVFAEPVQGPVIAGRLKYFGMGLFRPTP